MNTNHFLLITGAPGVGKSTLANMLTFQLLAEDFELIYVREITEAEEAYIPRKKQIFYFDDFLGSIELDLYSSRNADSAIVNFIERVRTDKNKRLILTSRTVIVNQAKGLSDKIQNSNIDISNYEVIVENYTDWNKARILYNHIYISNLEDEQKKIFFQNDFHWKVIKHKFYNPRLIQDITKVDSEYSEKYVIDILNDPKKVWEKPFNVEISHISRLLLLTMYSLGGGTYQITDERLKEAFDSRINFEVENNNYQRKGNEYNFALNELVGSFIRRTIQNYNITYNFFNPSIEDFIFAYFQNSHKEYFELLKSSIFFDQFKHRLATTIKKGEKRIDFSSNTDRKNLLLIFNEKKIILKGYHSDANLDTIATLIRLFETDEINDEILVRVNDLNISYLSWSDRDNLISILRFLVVEKLFGEVNNLPILVKMLSKDIPSHYLIESFANLIKENEPIFNLIKNAKDNNDLLYRDIQNNIDKSWEAVSAKYMGDTPGIDQTNDIDELEDIINERKNEATQINAKIGLDSPEAIVKYEFDTSSQIEGNKEKYDGRDINIQGFQDDLKNEALDINRLFNSITESGEEDLSMVPF